MGIILYLFVAMTVGMCVDIVGRVDFQARMLVGVILVMKMQGLIVVTPITIMGWNAVGWHEGTTGVTMVATSGSTVVIVPPHPVARPRDSVAAAGTMRGMVRLVSRIQVDA